MARKYDTEDHQSQASVWRTNTATIAKALAFALLIYVLSPFSNSTSTFTFFLIAGVLPFLAVAALVYAQGRHYWIEAERAKESERRGGKPVLGMPPDRHAFSNALEEARAQGKSMLDRYLVGFEVDTGEAIWVDDDAICEHGAVFAKTGVGKTLWLESLMFQQMARGRASGLTFIDAKRDPGTLADIILMAVLTGRIEDLIVIDPFEPASSYNFVFTTQRPDVKARKVLRCGLPPTSDASVTKHYDRLASDAVYRVVRAMESLGLAWSVRDIAVALSAFGHAYPRLRSLLHEQHENDALIELGHMADTYRSPKGTLDPARLTENLRGIASELHSISNSEAGEMFCVPRADLSLTDAIHRGKIIYYMLPRLEEAESAARMVKVFREDLEVSIGEVTSSRVHHLEDPHIVFIDEGASTFGPTWANLFELARKGRFALLFGAQSVGGLMDETMGLSEQFYERVIANVNLKVIMRLGDNKTAEDMADWIGEIITTKKSLSTAVATGVNARELTKSIEFNRRSSDSFRDGVTIADEETYLVSPEELKHEMAAEKGLAWFDKGDGILRKGRSLWFNAGLPSTWEGREFLVLYDSVEADEIGLAEWVDEQILSTERDEREREMNGVKPGGKQPPGKPNNNQKKQPAVAAATSGGSSEPAADKDNGKFKLNLAAGFRGQGRSQTTVMPAPAKKQEEAKPEPKPAEKIASNNPQSTMVNYAALQKNLSKKLNNGGNGQSTPPPGKTEPAVESKGSGPKGSNSEPQNGNSTGSNGKQTVNSEEKAKNSPKTAKKKGGEGKFSLRGRGRDIVT